MKICKTLATFAALASISGTAFATAFVLVPNVGTTPGPAITVTGSVGGDAIFQAIKVGPTGTGIFQPFLRVQQHGNNTTELGYNSNNFTNNAKPPVNFTHDLPFSSLQINNIGGTDYYQFYLDMAQSGNDPTITLTKFDLGLGAAGQSVVGATTAPTFSLLAYSLGANTILMTDVNPGNGYADVSINIPVSAFLGATSGNVILYAGFSNANSSFEEFGTLPAHVPDSGLTIALLGVALAAVELLRRAVSRRAVKA
jgi:hypothetical protein